MPENKNLSLAQQALVLSGRLRSLVREQQALADELSSIAHRLHRLALEIPEEQQPKSDTSSVEKDESLLPVTQFPEAVIMKSPTMKLHCAVKPQQLELLVDALIVQYPETDQLTVDDPEVDDSKKAE